MILNAEIGINAECLKIASALHNENVIDGGEQIDLGSPSRHIASAAVSIRVDGGIENARVSRPVVKSLNGGAQHFRRKQFLEHAVVLVEYAGVLNPERKLRRSVCGN